MAIGPEDDSTPSRKGDESAAQAKTWLGMRLGGDGVSPVVLVAAILVGFYVLSQRNFLLFHSLVEVLAGVIAIAIFMLFWNAHRLHGQ